MLSNIRSFVRTYMKGEEIKISRFVEFGNSFTLTVPSGSMSSKCFGVCCCNPVNTYWPGFPCDSRTKKSPSCFNNASAAWRLIDAWNQSSVSSCDRCTSAVNENGSAKQKTRIVYNYLNQNLYCSTYAYQIRLLWLLAVLCCYFHRSSCHSHNLGPAGGYSNQSNYYSNVRAVSAIEISNEKSVSQMMKLKSMGQSVTWIVSWADFLGSCAGCGFSAASSNSGGSFPGKSL